MAHQRRLDRQHCQTPAGLGLAMPRRGGEPPQAGRAASPAQQTPPADRDRHGDRSRRPDLRPARGQSRRYRAGYPRSAAIAGSGRLPSHRDRVGRRTPFAMYTFVAYMGVLGLGLHVLRIAAAALLLVSALAILDRLFALDMLLTGGAINPVYFAGTVGSYLVLALFALFTVVPRR